MRESASDRTSKYIEAASASLKRLQVKGLPATVKEPQVRHVLEMAQGYVKDARHYAEKQKPVTSLACVAYAEGLLDAIRFLELVEF